MEEKKTFFIAKAEFRPAAGDVTLQKQTEIRSSPQQNRRLRIVLTLHRKVGNKESRRQRSPVSLRRSPPATPAGSGTSLRPTRSSPAAAGPEARDGP